MAGRSVSVVRSNGERSFESRDVFVHGGGPVGAESQICQVIDRRIRAARLTDPAGGGLPMAGVPWLTPVLGSGCLDVRGSLGLSLNSFNSAVRERIEALVEKKSGCWEEIASQDATFGESMMGGVAECAGTFAAALAGERLILEAQVEPTDDDPDRRVEVTDEAAVALVGASALNRLYFLAKARLGRPAAKSDTEAVTIGRREDEQICKHICEEVFISLQESIPSGLGESKAQVSAAILRLLERLQKGLGGRRVELADLRLFTEVAWYLLISPELALYPGWGDLLFKLMLVDDTPQQVSSRPWFNNLSKVGPRAVEFFRPPTEQSWKARTSHVVPQGMQARFDLYDALAEVLVVQSEAHRGTMNPDLPVPAAFVTSFDVELEMALHSSLPLNGEDGSERNIFVVVPVQVLKENDADSAKLCWLRGRIDRKSVKDDGSLDTFLRLKDWELVRPTMEAGLHEPHVVHLGGSPLFDLPRGVQNQDVANQLSDAEVVFDYQSMVVAHAVGVDEYLALQQSEDEILWSLTEPGELEGKLSLPALLTSSSKSAGPGANPRYWVILGVPLDDPAVRNRVVTHLTLQRLRAKVPPVNSGISQGDDAGGFGSYASDESGGFDSSGGNDPMEVGPLDEVRGAKKVFVSHTSSDKSHSDQVVKRLQLAGLSCSYSRNDIEPGEKWRDWIDMELSSAGALVVLVSEASSNPDGWVLKEIDTAQEKGLLIIVLIVDGYKPRGEMERRIGELNHKQLNEEDVDDRERMWASVIDKLRECVGAQTAQGPSRSVQEPSGLVGVVVNLRLSPEDSGVLHWLGFDVVRDEAEKFVDDLQHYSEHVRARTWRIPENASCVIGAGGPE